MTSVMVPVGRSALGRTFAAMRQWLDHNHCENATFRELATNNGLLVQVGFGDAAVASEFASQFGGRPRPETIRGSPPDNSAHAPATKGRLRPEYR